MTEELAEVDLIENEAADDVDADIQENEDLQETEEAEENDEVTVTIGEDSPPSDDAAPAPAWVKELRKANREKEKEIRQLKAQLAETHVEKKPTVLGPKPKLEDFDYDSESYESALDGWFEQKRKADEEAAIVKKQEEEQQREWEKRLSGYEKAKSELRVGDYEDAELVAQDIFSVTQQGIVIQGAENPALVVYALGKNPNRAKELASIKDPVKFAFAVAKLEKELKVTNRKAPPAPEKTIKASGRISGAIDSNLDRLRAEAAKTGDYTKVIQYKAKLREKQSS